MSKKAKTAQYLENISLNTDNQAAINAKISRSVYYRSLKLLGGDI